MLINKKEVEKLIQDSAEKFASWIPQEDEEREELINLYVFSLKSLVESCIRVKSNIKDEKEMIKWVRDNIDTRECNFKNMNINSIKKMLIEDKALEQIRAKSLGYFRGAISKQQGQNVEVFNKDEEENKINQLLSNVKEYNLYEAMQLMSEGLLDLNYIINEEVSGISFRLKRYINEQRKEEEK